MSADKLDKAKLNVTRVTQEACARCGEIWGDMGHPGGVRTRPGPRPVADGRARPPPPPP